MTFCHRISAILILISAILFGNKKLYEFARIINGHKVLNEYRELQSLDSSRPLRIYCGTCAYVVSSGHLLRKGRGIEIDKADCVFRSNTAPIFGYEDDVGRRTTLRTMSAIAFNMALKQSIKNGEPYFDIQFFNESIIINYENISALEYEEALTHFPDLNIYVMAKERRLFLKKLFESVKQERDNKMSNGFLTINLSMNMCKEVHVYGMSPPDWCKKVRNKEAPNVPYHYHEPKQNECDHYLQNTKENHSNRHVFNKEKLYYAELLKSHKNLHFHEPTWPHMSN